MTQMILNWVADTFARSDIIDLYFIVSDLIDIPLTDDELCEQAYFDTMAMRTAEGINQNEYQGVPLGKLVL
jgi:siroheme synthase (precorrin-2 oxidase/ferrochelatase)